MNRNVKELVKQMTLEEKAGMCSGKDFWHLKRRGATGNSRGYGKRTALTD